MKEWILAIAAVCILSTLLELFLAEGETKKYVRGILSLIVVFVVISPLPKLINRAETADLSVLSEDKVIYTDVGFLNSFYVSSCGEKADNIEKRLEDYGVENATVTVSGYLKEDNTFEINNITVDITNAVITVKDGNININDLIIDTVKSATGVSKERISIYGGQFFGEV